MRLALSMSFAMLLLVVAACSSIGQNAEDELVVRDPLPETWNLREIATTALRPDEAAIDSDILCWQIREDGRPLLVESCILWVHLKKGWERKWRLSHLYRHPQTKNQWDIAMVMDAPIPYERDFDHPPSSAEVLDFIDSVMWEWELQEESVGFVSGPRHRPAREISGFKYIDGHVCLENWQRRTGDVFGRKVPEEYIRQSE